MPGLFGDEAVHLPGQVVLDVTCRKQHARDRQDPPRAARRQQREPVADRRPGEFEVPGGEIEFRQARAQTRCRQLEFAHRLGIPAAVAAQQHCRLCSFAYLPGETTRSTPPSRRRSLAAADRRPRPRCVCSAICRRSSATFRTRSSSPAARSRSSTAGSTARPAAKRRAASAASSPSSCWSAARRVLGLAIERVCRGSLLGAAVEAC